jgi:phosphoribulokinase
VLRKGVEEVIEDVIKYIRQLADVIPVVWSEAIQKAIQEWTARAMAVDAVGATGL